MIVLSVIIPSWKDPLLQKTIDSLLEQSRLGDKLEILPVLDGYTQELRQDPRVRVLHHEENLGMREAINTGVEASCGIFIMRTDEHCVFGDGYDEIMTETCKYNWIMTARRYFLDPEKWQVMDLPYVDCEKLIVMNAKDGRKKFSGRSWNEAVSGVDAPFIESMAMQGSMWLMHRSWWDAVIGALQTDGYGPLYQDSIEMVMKTWVAGGKLMVNRHTWFAHKHRSFRRTHNHTERDKDGWTYALETWGDYYEKVVRPRWGI